jgi:hypothetical protein
MGDLIPVNVNADISDSSNKIIVDLFGPASKQLGMALGNVFGLINTVTMPAKLINEYATRNFENVGEKISQIPEEKIKPVEPEIAIPLIEKLSYTSNEDLANAYVNLLSNASNIDKMDLVHPGFINKINSMAPDEAKLLEILRERTYVYYIIVRIQNQKRGYQSLSVKITGLEKELNISPQQIQMHFENLVSLSIIEDNQGIYKDDDAGYQKLIEMYQNEIDQYEEKMKNGDYGDFHEIKIEKSYYALTTIGSTFIEACIKN